MKRFILRFFFFLAEITHLIMEMRAVEFLGYAGAVEIP